MKGLVLALLTVASAGGSAFAADMPVKARPAPPPVYTWTGCYLGANAGGIFGADRYSLSMGGDFLLAGNAFSNPANNALLASR